MQTNQTIQSLTLSNLSGIGVSLDEIRRGKADNPFPVGTRNLYKICKGKPVSFKILLKMADYFDVELEVVAK